MGTVGEVCRILLKVAAVADALQSNLGAISTDDLTAQQGIAECHAMCECLIRSLLAAWAASAGACNQ